MACACLACAASVFAAASAPPVPDLDVARAALRDGLWDVARAHAARTNCVEAKLIVLESHAGEGKWNRVGETLASWPGLVGDGFDYYRAVVKGDHAAAMAVLKRGGSPEGLVQAKLFEADALARGGDAAAAAGLWRDVAASTNVGERAYAAACANLMDVALLREAYGRVRAPDLRRRVGLRLGRALLREAKTADEGEKTIRGIVRDAPDSDGALGAFLAVADAKLGAAQWKAAADVFREAIETWPKAAQLSVVQEGRGWALRGLGRREEALEAFRQAGQTATNDEARAVALLKEGDVLQEMGRGAEAMARYRDVLKKYAATKVAQDLAKVVRVRELESGGYERYRAGDYAAAEKAFAEVERLDASRAPRMQFLSALCQYGQGRDETAERRMRALAASPDGLVRTEATLWLAKCLYNRRDWKEARRLFEAYADAQVPATAAAEALLWAARAASEENDFARAIKLATRLVERHPDSPFRAPVLLVQAAALIELARFDEALLVLEPVAAASDAKPDLRVRAQRLRADALYAMGADNAARYAAALEAYRAIRFGGELSPSDRLVVSFRIARTLEKLKRLDEAIDQYYSEVVLAYRAGRQEGGYYTEEARAAFSRAAFRLADEYEGRGRTAQAAGILELVAASDVPAAAEARKRLDGLSKRGGFL